MNSIELPRNKSVIRPQYFALQWHITERCNWNCRHCYQEEKYITKELSLQSLLKVFKQYLKLINYFNILNPKHTRLIIAGGEPLLRKDFFLFLEKIYKYNKYYLLSILTNGALVTKKNASRLKSLGVGVVQVSLEGLEKNNDAIRGQGAFQKTIKAIEMLIKFKVKTVVCITLTKQSIFDISALIRLCDEIGVSQLGFRRLVPIGKGKELIKFILQPLELKNFYLYLENKQRQLKRKGSRLRLLGGCDESIFYPEVNRPLINCGVTEGRILTILCNGDVIACRRLPMKIGNVFEEDLLDIYYASDKLKQLRNLNNAFRICRGCLYFGACLSGAKCISYAYFGKISVPDPQCWQLFKKLPEPNLFKDTRDKISRKERVHLTLLPNLFEIVNSSIRQK